MPAPTDFVTAKPETSRSARTAFKLIAAALFLFVTGGPAVIAEGGDNDTMERFTKPSTARPFGAARAVPQPRAPYASRTYVPREKYRFRAPLDSPSAPTLPAAEPTFFISVMGDSLGQMLAQGLQEALVDRPDVLVRRKARESSGIVRDDFYDWPKAAREIAAGPERVDLP